MRVPENTAIVAELVETFNQRDFSLIDSLELMRQLGVTLQPTQV